MKYTKFDHIINICLLLGIFAYPISECFINNRMPYTVGVSIINLAGLISILLFLDFYKFKMTNELKGVAFYLGLSIATVSVSVMLASFNGLPLTSDMFIGESFQVWNSAWTGAYSAQVLYMLGLTLFLACLGLMLRLVLLRTVSKQPKSIRQATG